MKKQFNKEYFLSHIGCYSEEKMLGLVEVNNHETIEDFLNWNIPIKDKFYFVRNYTELTIKQKKFLALECAKVSVKIYELKYPNDKIISEGIFSIEKYINGDITIEQFNITRKNIRDAAFAAADAADAASYAAFAAADAADAASYASDAAADAASYVAYSAAYSAANAADANSEEKIHTNNLLDSLKEFCKNQD